MARDARTVRGDRPFVFCNLHAGDGLDDIIAWLEPQLRPDAPRRPRLWDGRLEFTGPVEYLSHGHLHSTQFERRLAQLLPDRYRQQPASPEFVHLHTDDQQRHGRYQRTQARPGGVGRRHGPGVGDERSQRSRR